MKNKFYTGCSGFSEKLWKEFFYPENLPSKNYLEYYAKHLQAVEINSTFYRKPTLNTLDNWYQATPKNFKFFIKLPKLISHIKRVENTYQDVNDFCNHVSQGLKEKLEGFLLQMPPNFHYTKENLEKIIETFSKDYLFAVEFRHKSWWNDEVLNSLKGHAIFTGVSIPKDIPDDVIINSKKYLYYRLHGVPELFKSEYSEDSLDNLYKKLSAFKGTKYVFFNNTFGIAGIKNALYFDGFTKNNQE